MKKWKLLVQNSACRTEFAKQVFPRLLNPIGNPSREVAKGPGTPEIPLVHSLISSHFVIDKKTSQSDQRACAL